MAITLKDLIGLRKELPEEYLEEAFETTPKYGGCPCFRTECPLTSSRFIGHEEALNYATKLSISKSTGER